MAAKLDIWNQALSDVYSASVASLTEQSLEAFTCGSYYASSVAELLEHDHDWSFAAKRQGLAILTNDRPAEWAFAYALPSDCARPRRILPDLSGITADSAYYGPWGDWPLRGLPWDEGLGRFYIVEAGVIYCNFENASLAYTQTGISEAKMTALFARGLSLTLASKIVGPLKKNRELKGDLIKQAEVAMQRAAAADANRQPEHMPDFTPEAGHARANGSAGYFPPSR